MRRQALHALSATDGDSRSIVVRVPVRSSVLAASVVCLQFSHDPRGVPLGDDARRDVLGHDRPRTDDRAVPIVTPGFITARPPIQTSSPIDTGSPYSSPWVRSTQSSG